MNEEPPPPPVKKKQKRKIGFKLKVGLLAVIERKKFEDRPNYKAISARTGVSVDSLKQLWVAWNRGEIDIGSPETPEEKQIDAQVQQAETLDLLKRYQALLLKDLEAGILQAEDDATKGKKRAWHTHGLHQTSAELKRVIDLRTLAEKGYNSLLEQLASTRIREKPANVVGAGNGVPPTMEAQIIGANEEERALQFLRANSPDPDGKS